MKTLVPVLSFALFIGFGCGSSTESTSQTDEARMAMADRNTREGEAFLAANSNREGVVTLPSGLQYIVIVRGTGRTPTINDSVICHYRGTFIDGTEFDNSYERGRPVLLPVRRVIKGWIEALELMNEGSRWQLFVAPALAYGEHGAGQRIGPNMTLIFEIELIAVK